MIIMITMIFIYRRCVYYIMKYITYKNLREALEEGIDLFIKDAPDEILDKLADIIDYLESDESKMETDKQGEILN